MFPQQCFLVFPALKSSLSNFVFVVVLKLSNVDDDNTRERSSEIIVEPKVFKLKSFQRDYTYVGHPSPVKDENRVNMALGRESKLKTLFFHSRFLTCKTND